jgi:hypothetical protein
MVLLEGVLNTTMAGVTSISSTMSVSPIFLIIVVMIAIILTLFMIYKSFRLFISGAIVTGILVGIYKLAGGIVNNHISGDGTQWNLLWISVAFVIVSIMVGAILYTIPSTNQLLKSFDEDKSIVTKKNKKNKGEKNG